MAASLPNPTGMILSVKLLLILLIGSFCIVEINGGVSGVAEELVSKSAAQREFDFFTLPLRWPGTYCGQTSDCCSSNACCGGSNSLAVFTIRGLWPDYNDGTWPSCCNGPKYNASQIEPLRVALDKYWPSLSCDSSSNCHGEEEGSFWALEWEQHGTCSSPVLIDQYTYFSAALKLYVKYNVTEVLNEAGYVPSNTAKYPVGGIISAIQNAFHTTPQLVCSNGAVAQLRLCFYKDFTLRDCAISSSRPCPSYVSLPPYVTLGLNNGGTADSSFPHTEGF